MRKMRWDRRQFCLYFTASCGLAWTAASDGALAANGTRPQRTVLVLGDSMSAEYGLPRGQGWVSLLEKKLASENPPALAVNASISGETTAGGRSRLPTLLQQHRPTHMVLELGGNDALRGLPLSMTQANLQAMAQAAQRASAHVLLVGMQVPPNYGRQYSVDFAALFGKVAQSENTRLVPFLLDGVPDGMFQSDRIHPTVDAQGLMLDNVWPVLKTML